MLWGLKELDVDFEFVLVNLFEGEYKWFEFLCLNLVGKVLVLVDGDFVIFELVVIVLYFVDKYLEKVLLLVELVLWVEVYWWVMFVVMEFE